MKYLSKEQLLKSDSDFCTLTRLLSHGCLLNEMLPEAIIRMMKRKRCFFVCVSNAGFHYEIIDVANRLPMYYFKTK